MNFSRQTRRHFMTLINRLSIAIVSLQLAGCAGFDTKAEMANSSALLPPIVFVHGNGDTAAIWQTTLWRFESNGWPTEKLHALEMPLPLARDNDEVAQVGRSSTQDQMNFLAAEVAAVLKRTGAKQVVLIANSRGGYAVRNYLQNGGGSAFVSHAILSGVPNHGVWAIASRSPGSEFNGAGKFLLALNAPKNTAGDEVVGPVKWLTLRSDNNDKFAQPDGTWIGAKDLATGVTSEGPALKGAKNIVLPKRDHREVAFHADAFKVMVEFITGQAPRELGFVRASKIILSGTISQLGVGGVGDYATNLPLEGAKLEIYAVGMLGERLGLDALKHSKTTGKDGQWGPFAGDPSQSYEFVISAPGYATTHIYRSAFARSSAVVNMRPARLAAADKALASVVTLNRSRGYFGLNRDEMLLDGKPLPGIVSGVAGTSAAKLRIEVATRGEPAAITGLFNGEKIVGRAWPAAENRVVVLDLHD
jgi:triacylglycerol lipase